MQQNKTNNSTGKIRHHEIQVRARSCFASYRVTTEHEPMPSSSPSCCYTLIYFEFVSSIVLLTFHVNNMTLLMK